MDVRLPNGFLIRGVPDGTSKEDIARKAIERGLASSSDFPGLDDTTLFGRAVEFAKGVPRGFVTSYASALEGTGELADIAGADDENALTQFGRRANESIMDSLGAAPGYEDLWTTKFGDALGSLASFFTPGVALKALGYAGKAGRLAAGAGLGATMTAGTGAQRIQQAREEGIEVSEETEDKAVMLNALIGLTEIAPVEKILRGIPAEALGQPFMKSFWPRLKSALGSGSVEAVQEVTSGLAQDAVEKGLYRPDLQIGTSAWDDMTLGGAAGATADLLLNAVAGRRIRGITEQEKERERGLRQKEKERAELTAQSAPEDESQSIAGLLAAPAPLDPENPVEQARVLAQGADFPIGRTFTSLDADGTPTNEVRTDTGEVFQQFKTPEQAALTAAKLSEESLNRQVDEEINLSVNQSGVDYTPGERSRLRTLGRRLFHPAENTFTREQVNYAGDTVAEQGYENEQLTAQEALDAGISPQKMTMAQRINAKRLRNNQRESNTFTVAEARAALKDNFGRLSEFDPITLGANETFAAEKEGDRYVVRSNFGETVRSRPAAPKEKLENPDAGRVAFNTKKEATAYADYLNTKTGDVIRRSELRDEAEITPRTIERLLRSKNILNGLDSPQVRHMAQAVTGHSARGKTAIEDMSAGERAMLYRKLRGLPAFEKPTKLPDFRPRPYTAEQYRFARQAALDAMRSPETAVQGEAMPSKERVEKQAGPLTDAAYNRLQRDLAQDARLKREMEVEANRARQLRAREKRLQEQGRAEQAVKQDEFNKVMKAVKKHLRGFGMDRVGLALQDEIRTATKAAVGAETEGGYSPSLNKIFLSIESLKRTDEYVNAPAEQKQAVLEQLAIGTLNHEVVHAMRQADLFTNEEWQLLEKRARAEKTSWEINGQNKTGSYTQWASELYGDKDPVTQMEEAIAEMVRDMVGGKLTVTGKPQSLLRRIAEFLKGIVGIKAEGYTDIPDIIDAIKRGEIGAREEGPIRTLRATEALQSRRMKELAEQAKVIEQDEAEEQAEAETGPPPKAEAVPGQSAPDFVERRVWHGSPYVYAKPDLSKVGAGEGVQAFGWGYYVADSQDVARMYQENLAGPEQAGQLYEVEVDDAVVDRMLDWDKPLSEQSEAIQAMFFEVYEEPASVMRSTTGEDLYRDLARNSESQEAASMRLAEKGVPGIKYLDAASRPGGRQAARAQAGIIMPFVDAVRGKQERADTSNYVVFDEGDIQLVSRNGQPIEQVVKEQIPQAEQLQEQAGLSDVKFSRRLARAQEQGFDVSTVWYHGTQEANIDEFYNKRGVAGFFSRDPAFASRFAPVDDPYGQPFAGGGLVYPVFLRAKNTFDPENQMQLRMMDALLNDPANEAQLENGVLKWLQEFRPAFARGSEVDMRVKNAITKARNAIPRIQRGGYDWVELEYLIPAVYAAGFDSYVDYEFAGEPATGLGVFNAADIKGVFAKFDPEAVPEGAEYADDIMYRRRVSTTGKYVGAPAGINSPQKLGAMLTKVKNLAEEGEPGQFWYERSGRAILNFVGGDLSEAEKLTKAIAITSVGTRPELNFRFALQAYVQHKDGRAIRTGRRPDKMSEKLQKVFDGEPWTGMSQKTKNFYNNLMAEIDPSRTLWEKGGAAKHETTVDVWVMRSFGYFQEAPTTAQYKFVADEIKRLSDRLGWKPHQTQAAIWVAMKARAERPDVKRRTNEISIRNGWAKRVTNKEGKKELVVTNKEKHAKNWFKQAMLASPSAEDMSRANFAYDNAISNTLGQISWESAPGRTTGHLQELLDAPMEVRKEFHRAMAGAFLDKDGRDIAIKAFGLPSPRDFEAPGYWEGETSPSTQTEVGAPPQYKAQAFGEIEQSAEALIEAYAAVRGILMRQDAVGWHRPFFDPGVTLDNINGVEVDIGRPFTEEETLRLGELLAANAGQDLFDPANPPALVAGPTGIRILNDEQVMSNKQFRDVVERSLASLRLDGDNAFDAKWFRSQGNLLKHDWKGASDGKGYLQAGRLAGRPDLQQRVRDLVAQLEPRVKAVEQEFVDRYGWTAAPDLRYARRPTESAARPGTGRNGRYRGLNLSGRSPSGARTYQGVHYGRAPVDILRAEKYGTGIRGAEAERLKFSDDPRIKRRVYFYIEPDYEGVDDYMRGKLEGRTQPPEAGLGPHVFTQTLGNILDPNSAEAKRIKRANPGPNEFESAVVDAGYDGYAAPGLGMLVVLDHDVPASYQGATYELEQRGIPARRDRMAAIVAENESAAKRDSATSFVPNDSHLASPEAQYIARNPDEAATVPADLKRSLRPAEYTPIATTAAPSERTPFVYYDMATGALSTPSRVRYYIERARQAAVNKYSWMERLNYTTELRDNLADTSSISALLMQDRALGVVAGSIRHGVPVYVNGTVFAVNKNTIPDLMKKNPQAAQQLQQALNEYGIDPNNVKSLVELMAPLYSQKYNNLKQAAQDYAISQRSMRLNEAGKEVPVTPEDRAQIEAQIARFTDERGNNIIKQWYADWQAYNNAVIRMAEAAGVLNPETAKLWRDMADYYPFYRVAEGGGKLFRQGQRVFGGLTAATTFRKLKGGESPINMDLEEAISLNLSAMIQMSMKNIAQQRTVRDLKQLGLAEELLPGQPSEAPVVEFRVAGRKRRYAIYDPLAHESLLPLDGTDVVAFVKKSFGLPATALRELVTRDPGFMVVNLMRDSLSSYVTSGAKLTPMVSTFKGLFDGIERLEKMGVVGGYDYANDPDNIAEFYGKELQKHHIKGANGLNIVKRLWDLAGRGTSASDAATRNAVFDDVWARTGNLAEAGFQAMEVINFARRGRNPLIRILSAVVPFLNARIQGVDLIYRSGAGLYTANREKNRRQAAASALLRGGVLMGSTALYWLLVSDDDQYKELSDFTKDNNWIIPTPWGVPFMIPIPFEVGLLFKTIPETVLETTYGEKSGKEAFDTLRRGVGSTLEVSPFQVQFMGPLLEATSNYNSFTGRQVVPQYMMDNMEAGLRSTQYSSEIAKKVGEIFNISPMKIDHVLRGYAGTIGQYGLEWLDVGLKNEVLQGDNRAVMPARHWYEYPMIKRLVGEENASGLVQDAYELYRDIDKVYSTVNSLKQDGRHEELAAYIRGREGLLSMRGAANSLKATLDKMRTHREHITRSDMPADLKQQQIDLLEAQINEILKGIVPQLKEAADQPFWRPTFQ